MNNTQPARETPWIGSDGALRMLKNLARGRDSHAHLSGRSAYGGATGTMTALCRRALLESVGDGLTDVGRAALRHAREHGRLRSPVPLENGAVLGRALYPLQLQSGTWLTVLEIEAPGVTLLVMRKDGQALLFRFDWHDGSVPDATAGDGSLVEVVARFASRPGITRVGLRGGNIDDQLMPLLKETPAQGEWLFELLRGLRPAVPAVALGEAGSVLEPGMPADQLTVKDRPMRVRLSANLEAAEHREFWCGLGVSDEGRWSLAIKETNRASNVAMTTPYPADNERDAARLFFRALSLRRVLSVTVAEGALTEAVRLALFEEVETAVAARKVYRAVGVLLKEGESVVDGAWAEIGALAGAL